MTPMRDAARVGQWILAGRRMPGKFRLGPWHRIKNEPLGIHLAVPFVGGKEGKRTSCFLTLGRAGPTCVPDCGGKQKQISTITHNGPPDHTIVFPKAIPHMHINTILI